MTSTPPMCHQTDTLFKIDTTVTPKEFSSPCRTRTAAKITIVCHGVVVENPHWISSSALMKRAAPKSMPAVTATWPRKLNQPVNHDHAAGLCGASLADQ